MKHIHKRLVCLLLALATIVSVFLLPVSVNALEDPEVAYAEAAYLYNLENEQAVYKLNADEKVYPAATVKLMTGIVALENLSDRLDETVTVTAEMASHFKGNKTGQNGLKIGETVVLRDMLGAMLVHAANDAAYVLALTVSESVEDFVLLMNKRANELGAYNTHYTNPTGMHDENMFTTAADTATVAIHAYGLEQFMDFAGLSRYTVSETNMSSARTLYSKNAFLSNAYEDQYFYDKARGMNAGSTYEGGYCVVTTATDGELTYLAVVLGAQSVDGVTYSYVNAKNLLEWAFSSFMYLDVLSPEQIMCEIPVTLATGVDHVTLVASSSLSVYLPSDTDLEKEITYSYTTNTDELQAPVKKGDHIGTSELISTADIERSDMLYGLHKISEFTKSYFFIATIVCIVVFSLVYVFGKAFILGRRNNKRYR